MKEAEEFRKVLEVLTLDEFKKKGKELFDESIPRGTLIRGENLHFIKCPKCGQVSGISEDVRGDAKKLHAIKWEEKEGKLKVTISPQQREDHQNSLVCPNQKCGFHYYILDNEVQKV